MDLTLNIYPEVRIGLEPNLRQIEFRVFCRLVIFQPVNSKEANIGSTQLFHNTHVSLASEEVEDHSGQWTCFDDDGDHDDGDGNDDLDDDGDNDAFIYLKRMFNA